MNRLSSFYGINSAKICWLKRWVSVAHMAISQVWSPSLNPYRTPPHPHPPQHVSALPYAWLTYWLGTKPTANVATWRARTEMTHSVQLKCTPPSTTPPNRYYHTHTQQLALSLNRCLVSEQAPVQAREFLNLRLLITGGMCKVERTSEQSARPWARGRVNYSALILYWF